MHANGSLVTCQCRHWRCLRWLRWNWSTSRLWSPQARSKACMNYGQCIQRTKKMILLRPYTQGCWTDTVACAAFVAEHQSQGYMYQCASIFYMMMTPIYYTSCSSRWPAVNWALRIHSTHQTVISAACNTRHQEIPAYEHQYSKLVMSLWQRQRAFAGTQTYPHMLQRPVNN